uniref:Uncharacterized protein n=1 Tax=Panstrongylus lignarius TaxID=156445 RepID=A0A224XTE5_9HEMI
MYKAGGASLSSIGFTASCLTSIPGPTDSAVPFRHIFLRLKFSDVTLLVALLMVTLILMIRSTSALVSPEHGRTIENVCRTVGTIPWLEIFSLAGNIASESDASTDMEYGNGLPAKLCHVK